MLDEKKVLNFLYSKKSKLNNSLDLYLEEARKQKFDIFLIKNVIRRYISKQEILDELIDMISFGDFDEQEEKK